MKKQGEYSDGMIYDISLEEALVLRRREEGQEHVLTNVPHLVTHHSPTGFEFGYGGSGPADLALNVCQFYLVTSGYQGKKTPCWDGECFFLAWALHQDFKRTFIEIAPHEGTMIPFVEIRKWFEAHITEETKKMYAIEEAELNE